jgi:hypothetical protein
VNFVSANHSAFSSFAAGPHSQATVTQILRGRTAAIVMTPQNDLLSAWAKVLIKQLVP